MLLEGKSWQTIWFDHNHHNVKVIDQTLLPHKLKTKILTYPEEAAEAIKNMNVRGAPLIGVTGAFGLMLGLKQNPSTKNLEKTFELLINTRPTAVNLKWALMKVFNKVKNVQENERAQNALFEAISILNEDIKMCSSIGDNGLKIIKSISDKKNINSKNEVVNVLTHCNAGWLATVDWGTALAPIYKAHRSGINLHVWVDETRPRNQGASLTAYELKNEGIPHTIIVDNAGGHLMQNKLVDIVIVGSDRTTRNGDVCNKIGTYLKALAAKDNSIPFYAALPISTLDWDIENGINEIIIESRSEREVTHISGLNKNGFIETIRLTPKGSNAFNPGFDVTPNNLVTGLITERGTCDANPIAINKLYS
tara:strand:+ start:6193 stop:7287 length:1095 start_codon:yes stop_codon:yes gene_type:complete